ncbi:unnamed protein product, partial [Discosporangium mesarthrocarpum]
EVCEGGGKTFQAIFGARTPLLEAFLVKRKLMGPCWITVQSPKAWPLAPSSYRGCYPPLGGGGTPPAPPVVTMSLSMKTVVSPSSHTHEVVALAALVHREVRLDGASEEQG